MISLTEKSADKIKEILIEQKISEQPMLRVGIKAGGCSGFTYVLDFESKPHKFDKLFESQGISILCDKKSLLYLKGIEIDWSDNLMDRGFRFNNPIAKSSCGCRTSFMPNVDSQQATPSWM